mgnify:CR=1 FL=1
MWGSKLKDDSPSGVCRTCGHGMQPGERLNADGSCPIRDAAVLEGVRIKAEQMLAETAQAARTAERRTMPWLKRR